jgi:hypothetical protein
MTYDPVPDLAALINGLHELARQGGSVPVLSEILLGPYARLRGGLLLDDPGAGHVSTENAIHLALALAGPAAAAPAARLCIVCGNPLPHQECRPVIIAVRSGQERRS